MGIVLPTLFALLAALSNALATVLQRRAALTVPQSKGFRPGLILDLLRRPVWLAGMLTVIAAGVWQAVALATGPLSLVQPLFVLELPLALLFASLMQRRRPSGTLLLQLLVVVAGLGLALWSAAPAGNRTHVSIDRWLPVLVACAGAVVLLALAGLKRPPGRLRAACLGTATAICFALTAGLMKTAVHILTDGGIGAFLTSWQTYAFAASGVCAMLLLEHAMQGGPLIASQPALTLGDATVSLLLGVLVYEERVRGGWWLLPLAFGVGLIVAGVLALARSEAEAL
ncbi:MULTISPECIES: DMT family transporter [unclassified Streptomyces]|uniref:DMT family transporter n=1 Tax=unclassified Streptomyces TaxID=2593676 RepID=UPI001F036A7D|nr:MULTISPECIES: DMT family transporter [unclassified Streptomyces]MCH0564154.1 DMT family transporter [Streptomyces sp. MUM 2J]MCH0568457.1 DMT family transporter [Streptomyces sp. MUM 136J]